MYYALNKISMDQPNWTFVAAQAYLNELYDLAAKNRGYDPSQKYGDFYSIDENINGKGNLFSDLLDTYSKQEVGDIRDRNQS